MPIGEQTTIASHTGNGVATVFAYSFGVLAADDIKVLVDGVVVTTGFTVSGIGSRTGGTVTFSVAPTSGADILIVREVVRKRDTDYQYSGDLREEVLDDDLDRIWMTLQEDGELVDRGVRVPVGETLSELPAAASRVDKVLTFGSGGAIALVDVAAFSGGGVVELVPADGSIALVKLTTAVQNLINGALQKSGGTMTAALVLNGDATADLQPLPRRQLRSTVGSSFRSLAASATGSSSSVSVSADEVVVRNASGDPALLTSVSLSIDSAASGVNGLDTGAVASNTWYAIWVIWNGTTVAGLLSLSGTAPTMPSGYTHKTRVGWIRTDGTANKYPLAFVQRGRRVQYVLAGALTAYPALFFGTTSGAQAVSVSSFCPNTAAAIAVTWGVVGTGSGATVAIGPNASSAVSSSAGFAYIGSSSNTFSGTNNCLMLLESSSMYVNSSNGNGHVSATGWEDNL